MTDRKKERYLRLRKILLVKNYNFFITIKNPRNINNIK